MTVRSRVWRSFAWAKKCGARTLRSPVSSLRHSRCAQTPRIAVWRPRWPASRRSKSRHLARLLDVQPHRVRGVGPLFHRGHVGSLRVDCSEARSRWGFACIANGRSLTGCSSRSLASGAVASSGCSGSGPRKWSGRFDDFRPALVPHPSS